MDLFFFLNLVLLFLLEIDFVILTITLHNRIFISDRDSFRIKYKVPYTDSGGPLVTESGGLLFFYAPATKSQGGGILIYPCLSIRPSGYRYMVCPAISSYSFGATALIFCGMFIHIMEVCMSTGF
jgi:hypothetical protein